MSIFSIFGNSRSNEKVNELYSNGAITLDVRSQAEFNYGHVEGSTNIPLNEIQNKLGEIKKWNKSVIACCRSGNRSGMAEGFLKQNGIDCLNGGSWQEVKAAIS